MVEKTVTRGRAGSGYVEEFTGWVLRSLWGAKEFGAWQGGAPCPADRSRDPCALSCAPGTHCLNNYFLPSPQESFYAIIRAPTPLCGQSPSLQRQCLFALQAMREGPRIIATTAPTLHHYPQHHYYYGFSSSNPYNKPEKNGAY